MKRSIRAKLEKIVRAWKITPIECIVGCLMFGLLAFIIYLMGIPIIAGIFLYVSGFYAGMECWALSPYCTKTGKSAKLEDLVKRVTPENCHEGTDLGSPVGNEKL